MHSHLLNIINKLTTTILLLGIMLPGCRSAETMAIVTQTQQEPLLLYQKTPCFGPCPSYEALVYTNGTVRFVPREHTPATDTLTFQLTDKELQKLITEIAELNYKNLQDLYKTEWSDMPSTHLYFYEAGKEVKHIKHQQDGPTQLIRFIEAVHELLWKYVATPAK
ncbi:MAG TPA: DUF6438 domain-containing protein [Pontibacter sp.]